MATWTIREMQRTWKKSGAGSGWRVSFVTREVPFHHVLKIEHVEGLGAILYLAQGPEALFEPLQGIEQKELGPSSGRSFQGVFVFHPGEQGCQSCLGWSCVHDARLRQWWESWAHHRFVPQVSCHCLES